VYGHINIYIGEHRKCKQSLILKYNVSTNNTVLVDGIVYLMIKYIQKQLKMKIAIIVLKMKWVGFIDAQELSELERMDKMEFEKPKPKQPSFKGTIQVPAWINKDKNGKEYISIQIFGMTINLWKYEPKPKEETIRESKPLWS
jgi:hypothetical protein